MLTRLERLCVAGILLALAAISLVAQSNTATIVGTVSDATGAAIPGAGVTVTNVKTQVVRGATSGADGAFEAPLLGVGDYALSVSQASFKRADRTGIHLDADQKAKIDITLQVGEITERVTVDAAACTVDDDRPGNSAGLEAVRSGLLAADSSGGEPIVRSAMAPVPTREIASTQQRLPSFAAPERRI